MSVELTKSKHVQDLLDRVSGLDNDQGDQRFKQIVRKVVEDIFETMEMFDIEEDELWQAMNFLQAGAPEFGLILPGVGIEHFMDLLLDQRAEAAGVSGGTPRTIEGPLFVAGAPISKGQARLDDGTEEGTILVMHGQLRDQEGNVVAGAMVDVWHANQLGNYSGFDPSQSAYNNRARIETDENGCYKFRSLIPSGYGVPTDGASQTILRKLGRHGNRPAHIHFFVEAEGYCHLTTQINIDGDPYLHDDFAFATREGLIPAVTQKNASDVAEAVGVTGEHAEIEFDFTLVKALDDSQTLRSNRARAS